MPPAAPGGTGKAGAAICGKPAAALPVGYYLFIKEYVYIYIYIERERDNINYVLFMLSSLLVIYDIIVFVPAPPFAGSRPGPCRSA